MRQFFPAAIAVFLAIGASDAAGFSGISLNFGVEYDPIAKFKYVNSSLPGQDIVDNIGWEPGVFYYFPAGFRAGTFFSYYKKEIGRNDNEKSHLSSWGIGVLGDYGYEITETGRTFLVGGMEVGYGDMTDKNQYSSNSSGAFWIDGIGGIRYFFTRTLSMEFDYRMKWLQYDFTEVPRKNYDYSGSTLRISLGYGIYSSGK